MQGLNKSRFFRGKLVKTPVLQDKIVREIIALARRERLEINHRMVTTSIAEKLSVSRSPVLSALKLLEKKDVVNYQKNRGYFLSVSHEELDSTLSSLQETPENLLYHRIADLHLSRQLPTHMNEAELMRTFDVSRSLLRKCLARILQEGWVEQNTGRGWHFLPVVDSMEAYDESFYFRIVLEPAALLSPMFSPDIAELDKLIQEQRFISKEGFAIMTARELFDANTRFHETIVSWSGNRFLLQSLKRLNQLRRLVEYKQTKTRAPRQGQASEHVEILLLIKKLDYLAAASLLKKHLEGARSKKVYGISSSDEFFD